MKTGSSEWIHHSEVDLSFLMDIPTCRRPVGNGPQRHRVRDTMDILCAFDIETSTIPGTEHAAIYHWQFQLGFDTPTIYGRTADEVRDFFDRLAAAAGNRKLVIYVHSLSYEFHFIRGLYDNIRPADVFSVASRKPVKVRLYDNRIELRCSYILTNMSLAQWTKKMHVEHVKKSSEDYDHTLVRFPWSNLTEQELEYCRNDVLGLIEALQVQLDINHDTLDTVPMTSTGYVRRDVKRVMKNYGYYSLQAVQPSPAVYVALREAFRGGNTHANRYMAGCILENVASYDRSSSYPEVCCNALFPMGPFRVCRQNDPEKEMQRGKAVLMRAVFTDMRLKDRYCPCPYLPVAKCRGLARSSYVSDNGRILSADRVEITMTDIDFQIVLNQYQWKKMEVIDMWSSWYETLPDMLRNLVISYYRNKTELKGVDGQEVYYDKAKALLNSIYGLQAQDPCRMNIIYNHLQAGDTLFTEEEGDIPTLLEKSQRQPYGSYQWGVWVTAQARLELQRGIDLAGDMFVYADTDSVKFCGDVDFSNYNSEKRRISTRTGAYAADPQGEIHYMGVYESEGRYDQFITYGAKKYAYVKNGQLGITIAGVNKKAGAAELSERGGIEALTTGFIFNKGGGTESVYNDRRGGIVEIDGHTIPIYPNIYIRPSTYRLGITDDYLSVLEDAELFRKITHDRYVKKQLLKK